MCILPYESKGLKAQTPTMKQIQNPQTEAEKMETLKLTLSRETIGDQIKGRGILNLAKELGENKNDWSLMWSKGKKKKKT